jgi:hypothetical protein
MTNQHPITPPPPTELVQQWLGTYFGTTVTGEVSEVELALATQAAQWGADQELEACCDWLGVQETRSPQWFDLRHDACALVSDLRAARRPKPSLKESALNALEHILRHSQTDHGANTIRRALEALDD